MISWKICHEEWLTDSLFCCSSLHTSAPVFSSAETNETNKENGDEYAKYTSKHDSRNDVFHHFFLHHIVTTITSRTATTWFHIYKWDI